jgi:hypothetical protein
LTNRTPGKSRRILAICPTDAGSPPDNTCRTPENTPGHSSNNTLNKLADNCNVVTPCAATNPTNASTCGT